MNDTCGLYEATLISVLEEVKCTLSDYLHDHTDDHSHFREETPIKIGESYTTAGASWVQATLENLLRISELLCLCPDGVPKLEESSVELHAVHQTRHKLAVFLSSWVLSRLTFTGEAECALLRTATGNEFSLLSDFLRHLRSREPNRNPSFTELLCMEAELQGFSSWCAVWDCLFHVQLTAMNAEEKLCDSLSLPRKVISSVVKTMSTFWSTLDQMQNTPTFNLLHTFCFVAPPFFVRALYLYATLCYQRALLHVDGIAEDAVFRPLVLASDWMTFILILTQKEQQLSDEDDRHTLAAEEEMHARCESFLRRAIRPALLGRETAPQRGGYSVTPSLHQAAVSAGAGLLSLTTVEEGDLVIRDVPSSDVPCCSVWSARLFHAVVQHRAKGMQDTPYTAVPLHKYTDDIDEFKIGLQESANNGDDGATASLLDASFYLSNLINHSCTPNSILVAERGIAVERHEPTMPASYGVVGAAVYVVALRRIEPLEEITISYTPQLVNFTVSFAEKERTLWQFTCRCAFCKSGKRTLLEGLLCAGCGMLVGTTEGIDNGCSSFRHGESCTLARTLSREEYTCAAERVAQQIEQIELSLFSTVSAEEQEDEEDEESLRPHATGKDVSTIAVERLLALDACLHTSFPLTHYARLRLAFDMFAISTAASALSATVSTQLQQLCCAVLENLELLASSNDPLLTGLRMYYVFSRARHLASQMEAEQIAEGRRRNDCCGAVREEEAFMNKPYVQDVLLRACIVKCFQEHFSQFISMREQIQLSENDILLSFLQRYPVELETAGVLEVKDMDMLSCMEQ